MEMTVEQRREIVQLAGEFLRRVKKLKTNQAAEIAKIVVLEMKRRGE